jgi:hypothetical protein
MYYIGKKDLWHEGNAHTKYMGQVYVYGTTDKTSAMNANQMRIRVIFFVSIEPR